MLRALHMSTGLLAEMSRLMAIAWTSTTVGLFGPPVPQAGACERQCMHSELVREAVLSLPRNQESSAASGHPFSNDAASK
jgi:hypothetical protein